MSEVAAAVARDPWWSSAWRKIPFVKRVRKALTDAGIAFTYLEYGSYFSQWKPRLAIKMWAAGQPSRRSLCAACWSAALMMSWRVSPTAVWKQRLG